MKQQSVYSELPPEVRNALDELNIEDSDYLTPQQCFEKYCMWHGLIGWNLWETVKACEKAVP